LEKVSDQKLYIILDLKDNKHFFTTQGMDYLYPIFFEKDLAVKFALEKNINSFAVKCYNLLQLKEIVSLAPLGKVIFTYHSESMPSYQEVIYDNL